MIIQLTGPQWNAVAARIPDDWKTAMRERRVQNYGRSHNYDLPAVCWRALFDHLSAGAVGPYGGFTKGPDALYSAISRIIRSVLEIEQHPALTPGRHVTGWLPDVIPAWETRPTRSCYPADAPFVLLRPRHITERGWRLTTWVSATDEDRLVSQRLSDREDVQLVLGRQFGMVLDGRELGRVPQDRS